jgi:hypothetical protein
MPLPQPSFVMAHGVLAWADPVPMDPGRDERFIAAVRPEFPNVVNRQMLPLGTPPVAPHLTLASTSSQLAISLGQADFEVRFYGAYTDDLDRSLEYVERKLETVRAGLDAAGLVPSIVGIVATLHFSCSEVDGLSPVEHVQSTLLSTHIEPDLLQDAVARVAVKVRGMYFVTMTVANYEARIVERPMIPGVMARVRPWEGTVQDQGIELTIDINNSLEGRETNADPVVSEQGIGPMTRMLREVATTTGPAFAERGELLVEALTASSQA